eukprot:99885_1
MSIDLDPTAIEEGRVIGYTSISRQWKQNIINLAVIRKISNGGVSLVDIDQWETETATALDKIWSDLVLIAPVICEDALVGYRGNTEWNASETYYILEPKTT